MSRGALFGTVLSPRAALATLRGAPAKEGALPVIVAGLGWAALSLVLAANGEEPSRPAPLIPASHHYLAQALFVVPLFLVSWRVLGAVAGRIVGAPVTAAVGYAYGVPLSITWALPDAVALGVGGFAAMTTLVRFVAPITALYSLALTTLAIRTVTDASRGRAFVAALVGLAVQALVGAWALR